MARVHAALVFVIAVCTAGPSAFGSADGFTGSSGEDGTGGSGAAEVAASSSGGGDANHGVQFLTDDSYRTQLASHNLSLTMFMVPGDPKSDKTLPEFHAAASLIRRDLTLGVFLVDCMQNTFLCRTLYQVDTFPTTKIFAGGERYADTRTGFVFLDDYEGRFSAEAFAYSLFARRDGKFVIDQVKATPEVKRKLKKKQKHAGLPPPPEGLAAVYRDIFFFFKGIGLPGQIAALALVWGNVALLLFGSCCCPALLDGYLEGWLFVCCFCCAWKRRRMMARARAVDDDDDDDGGGGAGGGADLAAAGRRRPRVAQPMRAAAAGGGRRATLAGAAGAAVAKRGGKQKGATKRGKTGRKKRGQHAKAD